MAPTFAWLDLVCSADNRGSCFSFLQVKSSLACVDSIKAISWNSKFFYQNAQPYKMPHKGSLFHQNSSRKEGGGDGCEVLKGGKMKEIGRGGERKNIWWSNIEASLANNGTSKRMEGDGRGGGVTQTLHTHTAAKPHTGYFFFFFSFFISM